MTLHCTAKEVVSKLRNPTLRYRWGRWAAEQAPAAGQAQGGSLGPQSEPEPLLHQVREGECPALITLVPRYPRKQSLCITDHRLNMNSYLITEE